MNNLIEDLAVYLPADTKKECDFCHDKAFVSLDGQLHCEGHYADNYPDNEEHKTYWSEEELFEGDK